MKFVQNMISENLFSKIEHRKINTIKCISSRPHHSPSSFLDRCQKKISLQNRMRQNKRSITNVHQKMFNEKVTNAKSIDHECNRRSLIFHQRLNINH